MTLLTREQILEADDLKSEVVPVPEWKGSVRVRTMPGTVRDAYEVEASRDRDAAVANMRAGLVARCIVNELGVQLFTARDIEALGKKSGVALDRVARVAQRLNRMSDKDIEELKGNSEPSRGAAQSSDSP